MRKRLSQLLGRRQQVADNHATQGAYGGRDQANDEWMASKIHRRGNEKAGA